MSTWKRLSICVLTALSLVGVRTAHAGAIVHVETTEYLEASDSSDDTVITRPLRWTEQDRDSVQVTLYRDISLGVLPSFFVNNEVPTDPDTEIFAATQRAIQEWNDSGMSEFQFASSPIFSDQQIIYDPLNLPFGPADARLDRYNTITFLDPTFVPAEGLYYVPVIFYFPEKWDPSELNISAESIIGITGPELTEGDENIFLSREADTELIIPRRAHPAGAIIDADVIFSAFGDGTDGWWILPQQRSSLATMEPPLSDQEVLGQADVQAVITRALGEMAGLGASHLYGATMSSFYVTPNNSDEFDEDFLTDPYDVRSIELDDELTLAKNYPSDNYETAPGIAGSLLDGRSYDATDLDGNDDGFDEEVGALPQQIVYFGVPSQSGWIDLDTVAVLNPRESFGSLEEIDVGPIQLLAHTVTGTTQIAGAGPNSPFENTQNNGLYELRGLPARDDWYVFTTPLEFAWDAPSTDQLDAPVSTLHNDFPVEFFGGVEQPGLRFGRFNLGQGAIDRNDGDPTSIQNSFAEVNILGTLIDNDANGVFGENVTEVEPNGQFWVGIRDGIAYTNPAGTVTAIRLYRQTLDGADWVDDVVVYNLDSRGNGYGNTPGTLDSDDSFDTMEVTFGIDDPLGNPIGTLTQTMELVSYEEFVGPGESEKKGWKVTWEFENGSSTYAYRVAIAHLYNTGLGIVTEGEDGAATVTDSTSKELFVNGERQDYSTGFGGAGEDPVPVSVDWFDNYVAPYFQFSVLADLPGSGLTPPDRVLTVDFARASLSLNNLWDIEPGQSLRGPGIDDVDDDDAFAITYGVLMRWDPVQVTPGGTMTVSTGGIYVVDPAIGDPYIQDLRDRENGVPLETVGEEYADLARDGYPLDLTRDGDPLLSPIDIITNTGTRPVFDADDNDGDGISNDLDNCPFRSNPDQEDTDGDGIGDACEGDVDSDDIDDPFDNCVETPNEDQRDLDGDGIGDACDEDLDGDGILNSFDVCPLIFDPGQADSDNDGIGDACDSDYDGDGFDDQIDNCPTVFNPAQRDIDADGIGDYCDNDIDGDGIDNLVDICPNTANPDQEDLDENGVGDACERGALRLLDRSPASVAVEEAQIPAAGIYANDAAVGDINNDGYPDMIIAIRARGDAPEAGLTNRIYLNEGEARPGYFIDATFGVNGIIGDKDDRIALSQNVTSQIILFDFDLDGDLDFYESNLDGQNRLWMNYDVDDPDINPAPDNDPLGDGFFLDVTGLAMPGILNTKGSPFELFYETPNQSTRCRVADVDGDGDEDIIVANLDLGPRDIAGTLKAQFTFPGEDGELHGPSDYWLAGAGATKPFLEFSERVLINRRDELLVTESGDCSGEDFQRLVRIPRGTPDPFVAFQSSCPTIRDQVFPPQTNLDEIRRDGFWFRDETLGLDMNFTGDAKENADRLPPTLPDFYPVPNPITYPTDIEYSFSTTAEVGVGRWMTATGGPDLFVADRRERFQSSTYDGYNPVLINTDFDGDAVADGIFEERNFRPYWDTFSANPLRQGIPDGIDDSTYDPNNLLADELPLQITNTTSIRMADIFASGWSDFVSVDTISRDADPEGNHIQSTFFVPTTGPSQFGRAIGGAEDLDGQTGGFSGVYPHSRFGPSLLNGEVFTEIQTPWEVVGRTQHVSTADLDRDGVQDIILATDAPPDTNQGAITNLGGAIGIILNKTSQFGLDSEDPLPFQSVGTQTLVPNQSLTAAAVVPFDCDVDGDIDLFVANSGNQSRLYINQLYSPDRPPNPRTISDEPMYFDRSRPMLDDVVSVGVADFGALEIMGGLTTDLDMGDIDRDGDIDILVVCGKYLTDTGDRSYILTNRGPSTVAGFQVFTPSNSPHPAGRLTTPGFLATPSSIEKVSSPGSKGKLFDFDNDGDLDLFMAYYGARNAIYENRDVNGSDYAEVPLLYEGDQEMLAIGTSLGVQIYNSLTDYDVVELRNETFPLLQRDMEGLGDGVYEDTRFRAQVERLPANLPDQLEFTQDVALGDIDNDGDIDMYWANGSRLEGISNIILINKTPNEDPTTPEYFAHRRFANESSVAVGTLNSRLPLVPFYTIDCVPTGDDILPNDDTAAAVFFDADNDGDLDLLAANRIPSDLTDEPCIETGGYTEDEKEERRIFKRYSQMLINDGDPAGGDLTNLGGFVRQANFPPVINATTGERLTFYAEAIAVADFGRKGDIGEDMNGDGIVTETEISKFEQMIATLQRQEDRGAGLFANNPDGAGQVRVLCRPVDDNYAMYVTQLVDHDYASQAHICLKDNVDPPAANEGTVLTQRLPRYIDMPDTNGNFNGTFDQILDVIIVTSEGKDVYLSNDGNGNFTYETDNVFLDDIREPYYDIDVGDVDHDGWLDFVVASSTGNGEEPSARLFLNTAVQGLPRFDQRDNEINHPDSTGYPAGASENDGVGRAISLFDPDADGDLDIMVGENGSVNGILTFAGLNAYYENRIIGQSFYAPANQNTYRIPNSGSVPARPLSVRLASPSNAEVGDTMTVRVYGDEFMNGASATFGSGIELLEPPIVRTDSVMDVTIRVRPNADTGGRTIRVYNPDGAAAASRPGVFSVLAISPKTGVGDDWHLYN